MSVKCPKCGANAHVFATRHSFLYDRVETELQCQMCGTRRYGAEAERIVAEARSHAERERAARAEQERAETAKLEAERAERERIEAERAEAERIERERTEAERLRLKAEAERVAPVPQSHVGQKQAAAMLRERLSAERAAAIAAVGVEALCAAPLCSNPPKANARYCGKACSDRVARAKYKAKNSVSGLS